MKSRMIWKLTACFTAVLLVFSVVLGTVFLFLFRQHAISINRTSMEDKAVSIADTFASIQNGTFSMNDMMGNQGRGHSGNGMGHGSHGSEISDSLTYNPASEHDGQMAGGMNGYGSYLRFLNELNMGEVWIVDKKLNVLTYGHEHNTSYSELPENAGQIVDQVFKGEVTYGEDFSGLLNAPYLTVGAPIRSTDGSVTGAVLLHSPVSGINAAVRQGLSALFGGTIAALIFAGAAALLLSYHFTKPLRRINTTAFRLAGGDYEARTDVTQQDEIGQVAGTIDLLAGRLAEAEKERAAIDKMREDFVANVSHELRTPVAVLRGSLEVLKDGTVSDPAEISDYYEQMLLESRHLERLVNDLLDLSRLQDDRFRLDMGEVNLCDVVRDASRAVRRAAQEKEIEITASCPPDACITNGDYMRIRQMLLIFLDNAVKFSDGNAPVEVRLKEDETIFVLSVSNSGREIPSEELPHIFDRFRKTHIQQNQSGTGLGLAIARQIAERHHAGIQAESSGGKTSFTVRFIK